MSAKISLCMIVGNEEQYIERCLNSFHPVADEICIVRAIGNLKADRTLDIAREQFGAKTGEYYNRAGHADWPHVDDFAAARQQSFDMATGDYILWCDADDILKCGADRIRKHAHEGGYACFMFPYDVFGKNVMPKRERLVLKNAGRWAYPVHECFKFYVEPVTAAIDEGVIFQHLPKITKTGSNERNLRILESIPKEEMNIGLKYHLFGELMAVNRTQEGIDLATEMLSAKDLGKDERYDLLLSLVIHTTNMDDRVALLHEAHKVDPERREALGVLSCTMMDMGKPASALAYARQMAATTEPVDPAWNSRRPFYGYIGDDIYQQALRVNRRYHEAEVIRRDGFKKINGPRISLLHATRGRPNQASKCRKAWHDLAEHPEQVEHIFAFDEDDKDSHVLARFHHVVMPAGGGCVAAWNVASLVSLGDVLIQVSDDWTPPPMWDRLILERLGDLSEPRVLAVSDGSRNDKLLCMAICSRGYYCQDFFLFHPDFTGVYSDNWFTQTAYARGQVIEARDIVFQHKHPAFDTAPMDATYAAQNSPERYAQGKAVYDELAKGKDWSSVPGFFNYWAFYKDVADQLKDGDTVAEVGVWLGRSIIFLAQTLKRQGKKVKLIAVDSFKGELNQTAHQEMVALHGGSLRKAFDANIQRCGVADMIEVIESDSAEAALQVHAGSLAFCYIDAAHDYDSVKRDINAWMDRVKPGGTFAGHDAYHEPVMKAVREIMPTAKTLGPVWIR